MEILVTGPSGEIGRRTVRQLVADGHHVRGTTRSDRGDRIVAELGAAPVRADLFDAASVRAAVADADVVLHLATAIPPSADMGDLANWEENDRLRGETTAHLAEAVVANGTRSLLLQSYFAVQATDDEAEAAGDAGASRPWAQIGVMDSMREAEETVGALAKRGAGGVVLRFGSLYSDSSEQLHAQVRMLAEGTAAIPGDGSNYWPFLASDDAGRALAAALELSGGTFDVLDDEPVTLATFWSNAASALGRPQPPHSPDVGGPMADVLLGSWRLSNRRFAAATGWSPQHPSVLEGWPECARRHVARGTTVRPRV